MGAAPGLLGCRKATPGLPGSRTARRPRRRLPHAPACLGAAACAAAACARHPLTAPRSLPWRRLQRLQVEDYLEKTGREERLGLAVGGVPDADLFFEDKASSDWLLVESA